MMHDDEYRSAAEIEALLAEEAASDPISFVRSHETLRREVLTLRRELKKSHERRASAEQEVKSRSLDQQKSREKLLSLSSSNDTLQDDLREVANLLDNSRAESRRLRVDLERVRSSRTFRLGKALMSPAKVFRPTGTKDQTPPNLATFEPAVEQSPLGIQAEPAEDLRRPAGSAVEPEVPVEPTVRRGRTPVHPDSPDGEGPGSRELPPDARFMALQNLAELIPPRAPGAVFPPEPGRLMYCTHSASDIHADEHASRSRDLAVALQRAGSDIRVVFCGRYGQVTPEVPVAEQAVRSEVVLDDVTYVHLPGPELGALPIDHGILEVADAFTREALRQRPDVIQSVSNFRVALSALIAARRVGVPFVYEVRGELEIRQSAGRAELQEQELIKPILEHESLVAREADAVIVASGRVEIELVSRGVEGARIIVTPAAVDAKHFSPLPKDIGYAESHGIRTDIPVIGFVGNLTGDTDLEMLLGASALLLEREVAHQVVIASPSSTEWSLHDMPGQFDESQVVSIGTVPVNEIPRLLSTFDIMLFTHSSALASDAAPFIGPLEAMASMKAVLLPNVAPYVEMAGAAQQRARLFRCGDADSLFESLTSLIRDGELRRDLGRTGRLWVLDEFPMDAVTTTMLDAHHSLRVRETSLPSRPVRSLRTINVGLIADEFTAKSLSTSVAVIALTREGWKQQLSNSTLDLVLVESAWDGNGGQWHGGIGDYGPEAHQDIHDLLATARELQIPTVFWNKEDPVHFKRFQTTAALCDHVFTTDADMISRYLSTPDAATRTASSMPFFAQPAIHNPLPTDRPYQHTVAYAGTYYGNRYPERSAILHKMLGTALQFGLTIYDRQAAEPDSPYRFPPKFSQFSVGALPYDEVIDSYKTHIAHLNGNSVMDSPTMFSRRAVEVAACGGVTLSGPGRGMMETFGGLIPASEDPSLWQVLLRSWAVDPAERVREAWRQMRVVHRAHTAESSMTVLLRTIGIPVVAHTLDDYAVVLSQHSPRLVEALLSQSWRPREVFIPEGPSAVTRPLEDAGIRVRDADEASDANAPWIGKLEAPVARTWFEDLLIATRFGAWSRIDVEFADDNSAGRTLASYGNANGSTRGLVSTDRARSFRSIEDALRTVSGDSVRLLVAGPRRTAITATEVASAATTAPRTVVVAGHDLKFAGALITALESAGHTVLIDQWAGHAIHDARRSQELLAAADTVFCEWGLGSAVWYSKNVQEHQRLVVRVHLQELDRPFLRRIQHSRVDAFVFVGELVRRAAVESHGVPESRSYVIPNSVDVTALDQPKFEGSDFNLGLVGVVPERKRLDLAVELLERLLERDSRYRLFVKGKRPEDYLWMADRTEQSIFYGAVQARIDQLNDRFPGAVQFDGYDNDMAGWYRKIGIAISVSDFESFHFTIADGAASGALPASLAWAGSDFLYPRDWLTATIDGMAESIHGRRQMLREERSHVREYFSEDVILPKLVELVAPPLPGCL